MGLSFQTFLVIVSLERKYSHYTHAGEVKKQAVRLPASTIKHETTVHAPTVTLDETVEFGSEPNSPSSITNSNSSLSYNLGKLLHTTT